MGSRETILSGKDLTPFHTAASHEAIKSAYDYVHGVIDTSDFENTLAWHGWALREAFLAGRVSMLSEENDGKGGDD